MEGQTITVFESKVLRGIFGPKAVEATDTQENKFVLFKPA
jgi:hypothetical protein